MKRRSFRLVFDELWAVRRQRETESLETANRASKVLGAGFNFQIWREALSSEDPVGGAPGTGRDGRSGGVV